MPENDRLFITGNLPELGNWTLAGVPVGKIADNIYSVSFNACKGSIVEFKLTRGTWKTQAVTAHDKIPPQNTVIKVEKSANYDFEIVEWLDLIKLDSDPVKGKLLRLNHIKCPKLNYNRTVRVWLPETYSVDSEPLSVIYMHDGQNLFEPSTSFAGADWKVDETISEMIGHNKIDNCVVVGIDNSPDRMKELNLYTPEGKKYADYIVSKVKPCIEDNFNVKRDAHSSYIMGSSMGGLMSFQMLIEYPHIFAGAGCLSASFQKAEKNIFEDVIKKSELPLNKKIYLDTGEYEPPIADAYFTMMELLKKKGFKENKNLFGYYDNEATHSEAAWAKRLHVPVKFLLGSC